MQSHTHTHTHTHTQAEAKRGPHTLYNTAHRNTNTLSKSATNMGHLNKSDTMNRYVFSRAPQTHECQTWSSSVSFTKTTVAPLFKSST